MPDNVAYKILTKDELDALEHEGVFQGSQVDRRDGFIHLSTADQLAETIGLHFAGREDIAIAAIDLDALGDKVRWETSRGGQLFPHLHDVLSLDGVLAYGPLERMDDGSIKLPVAG